MTQIASIRDRFPAGVNMVGEVVCGRTGLRTGPCVTGYLFRQLRTLVMLVGVVCCAVAPGRAVPLFAQQKEVAKSVDSTVATDDRVEIPVVVTLEYRSDDGGYFLAPIELPSLEGGKKYKLSIRAVNPTDRAIPFTQVIVECSCAKFETPVDVILPHDSATFFMFLDVPAIGGQGTATTGAKFLNAETRQVVLRLSLRYEVNNVFSLAGRRLSLEIPEGKEDVVERIPITIVPPLTIQDLEVEVSKTLSDFLVRLIEEDGTPYLEMMVVKKSLPREGVFGELLLKRKGFPQPFGLLVDVKHQEKIAISPESLRFTEVSGEKGRYVANAVLRVTSESDAKPEDGQQDVEKKALKLPSPEVAVVVGGETAQVSLRPLGRQGVYRLKIVVAEPEHFETVELKWLIRVGREERKIESRAFFSR